MSNLPAPMEIDLSAAVYLEFALQALQAGDVPRMLSCLASINARSWAALVSRFPGLPDIITKGYAQHGATR